MMPPDELSHAMTEVDSVMQKAIAAGDPLIVASHIRELKQSISVKGVALARLLYEIREHWTLFRVAGVTEDWRDFLKAHAGISSQTADKYSNMYEEVFVKAELSDDLRDRLAAKPIKSLLLLTAGLREGKIGPEELKEATVLTHDGIRMMLKEVRGEAKGSRYASWVVWVQRENDNYPIGTLVAFNSLGEREPVGFLKLEPETEVGRAIVNRISSRLDLGDIR